MDRSQSICDHWAVIALRLLICLPTDKLYRLPIPVCFWFGARVCYLNCFSLIDKFINDIHFRLVANYFQLRPSKLNQFIDSGRYFFISLHGLNVNALCTHCSSLYTTQGIIKFVRMFTKPRRTWDVARKSFNILIEACLFVCQSCFLVSGHNFRYFDGPTTKVIENVWDWSTFWISFDIRHNFETLACKKLY